MRAVQQDDVDFVRNYVRDGLAFVPDLLSRILLRKIDWRGRKQLDPSQFGSNLILQCKSE